MIAKFFQTIGEKIQGQAGIQKAFGEPIETQGKTVIPVARVSFGFGMGAVSGNLNDTQPGPKNVGGGGGGANIVPIGVLEITEHETRFIPSEDWRSWGQVFLTGLMAGLVLRRWLGRSRRAPRARKPK